MSLKLKLAARLQRHPKRVVFPDGSDPRVLQAARQFASMRLGVPILVGNRQRIKIIAARLSIRLDGIRIIEPERSEEFEEYKKIFRSYRRVGAKNEEGLDDASAETYIASPGYFASMMVLTGAADAMVCGVVDSSAAALRPVFQLFPRQDGITTVSSMQIMDLSDTVMEERLKTKKIFLADCTVIPHPNSEQLAEIGIMTASLYRHLTGERPKVAFLSSSTNAVNTDRTDILKVQNAVLCAREKSRELAIEGDFDGDLQADAALDPFVATSKGVGGLVAGQANVLIFPDLMSANIASKLVRTIADVPCYGQIVIGLKNPVAEISRGASSQDILGAAIIVAAQAVDEKYLFPLGD